MMELWFTDRVRLGLLVGFCALLASVESLVPLLQFRRGRLRRALPNLALALGVVILNYALASFTAWLSVLVIRSGMSLFSMLRWHPGIVLVAGIVVLDLFAYLAHLLMHKVPLGWKFHRVHHSEMEVDVTTAFRQHPGETLWRFAWQSVAIAVFGLPFWIFPFYLSLSGLNALLEHANVRVGARLDKWARLLLVTPPMHKIHHSRLMSQTNSNYSNIFSIWDRIFGTYTRPAKQQAIVYGLDGCEEPRDQTLTGLLWTPFRSS